MSQITTHILDTARGCPASGVELSLYQQVDDGWKRLSGGVTNSDGRVPGLLEDGVVLAPGTYRMHFATAEYFSNQSLEVFYPWADVVFNLGAGGEHYHIPLLLSPYGYSTYRGS